jgi:hypothetical protein
VLLLPPVCDPECWPRPALAWYCGMVLQVPHGRHPALCGPLPQHAKGGGIGFSAARMHCYTHACALGASLQNPPALLGNTDTRPLPAACCLQVLVEGRSGQALNLVGEKTPEAALVAAVAAAAAQVLPAGAPGLREWAAREVLHAGTGGDTAGHYVVYAELAGAPPAANGTTSSATTSSSSGGGLPSAEELAAFAAALDAALGEASPDYRVFRAGSVSGLELRLVGAGAFEDIRCGRLLLSAVAVATAVAGLPVVWWGSQACADQASAVCPPALLLACRQLAHRMGATAAQYKPPVTVNKPAQWQLLEQHVLASAVCP